MFSREKTKWLNILHAGWPGGLVSRASSRSCMGDAALGHQARDHRPSGGRLLPHADRRCSSRCRSASPSGVSYREMLAEFGIAGRADRGVPRHAAADRLLRGGSVEAMTPALRWRLHRRSASRSCSAFGLYTAPLGRPLMFFLMLIMMPLATTEIGTDGWITGIMEGVALRAFHAGLDPGLHVAHHDGPAVLRRADRAHASRRSGCWRSARRAGDRRPVPALVRGTAVMIFVAATLYGFGKTFFWPTMLGVVSEQTPERRRPDAQRHQRHRHAGGRACWVPLHRHAPGRQADRRRRRQQRRQAGARARPGR